MTPIGLQEFLKCKFKSSICFGVNDETCIGEIVTGHNNTLVGSNLSGRELTGSVPNDIAKLTRLVNV